MPCVRVPRLVARLVVPLVVDYFAYVAHPDASARHTVCRRLFHLAWLVAQHVVHLVVDYFAYTARPGASSRRAARLAARRRILHLRRASGCLGSSRGSSRLSSSTTSYTTHPDALARRAVRRRLLRLARLIARHVARLVVDYFAYAAHPSVSAWRAARHATRCQLLRVPRLRLAATLALLQPRRASRLLVSRQHWLSFE
jgi:hypothetical protein